MIEFSKLNETLQKIMNLANKCIEYREELDSEIQRVVDSTNDNINSRQNDLKKASDSLYDSFCEFANIVEERIFSLYDDANSKNQYLMNHFSFPSTISTFIKNNYHILDYHYFENPSEDMEYYQELYNSYYMIFKEIIEANNLGNVQSYLITNTKKVGEMLLIFQKMKTFANGLHSYFEQRAKQIIENRNKDCDNAYHSVASSADKTIEELREKYTKLENSTLEELKEILNHELSQQQITNNEDIFMRNIEYDTNSLIPFAWMFLHLGWLNQKDRLFDIFASRYQLNENGQLWITAIWDLSKLHNLIIYGIKDREKMLGKLEQIFLYSLRQLQVGMYKLDICCSSGEIFELTTTNKLLKDFPEISSGKINVKKQEIDTLLDNYIDDMNDIIQNKLYQYNSVKDFNSKNPQKIIPYKTLALIDFPQNYSEDMINKVKLLLIQGYKAGIQIILLSTLEYNQLQENRYDLLIKEIFQNSCAFNDTGRGFYESTIFPSINLFIRQQKIDYDDFKKHFQEDYEKENNKILKLTDIITLESCYQNNSAQKLSIPIGFNEYGEIQYFEMGDSVANGTSHYALIIGPTGSGKSSLLHTIIMSSVLTYSPEELELYLLDFKQGNEFKIYENYKIPHIKCLALDTLQEYGESILNRLWNILQKRNELFAEASKNGKEIKSITDYRNAGYKMPRILVIMDEFQVLFNIEHNKKVATNAAIKMAEFISKARVYGIHFVFATQTMKKVYESTALSKGTLAEMHIRIGLQCPANEMELVFGTNNVKNCIQKNGKKKGTGIYLENDIVSSIIAMQVAYVDSETQKQLLQKIIEDYSENGKIKNIPISITPVDSKEEKKSDLAFHNENIKQLSEIEILELKKKFDFLNKELELYQNISDTFENEVNNKNLELLNVDLVQMSQYYGSIELCGTSNKVYDILQKALEKRVEFEKKVAITNNAIALQNQKIQSLQNHLKYDFSQDFIINENYINGLYLEYSNRIEALMKGVFTSSSDYDESVATIYELLYKMIEYNNQINVYIDEKNKEFRNKALKDLYYALKNLSLKKQIDEMEEFILLEKEEALEKIENYINAELKLEEIEKVIKIESKESEYEMLPIIMTNYEKIELSPLKMDDVLFQLFQSKFGKILNRPDEDYFQKIETIHTEIPTSEIVMQIAPEKITPIVPENSQIVSENVIEQQKESIETNKMIVFKGKEKPIFDMNQLQIDSHGKQKFLLGIPLNMGDPVSVEISKKRKSNLLVVGTEQEILNNIARIWLKSALYFNSSNQNIYLFDGSLMIDEEPLIKDNTFNNSNVVVIDNVFHVLQTINKIYEQYHIRKEHIAKGIRIPEDKEIIHIVISNYQWIEPIVRIFEGKNLSEFELEENENVITDSEKDDEFTSKMKAFLEEIKSQNNSNSVSNIGVKEKFRRLLESGYLVGIQFVMTVSELNILKRILKSDLDPFTNRILLKTNDKFGLNYFIETDINMDHLENNIALFSDGIKPAILFKPYELE